MDNFIAKIKNSPLEFLLFSATTLCFKSTFLFGLIPIILLSLYRVFLLITEQINPQKLIEVQFYLVIYSLIFAKGITKVNLIVLLIFLFIHQNKKNINFTAEKVVLFFTGMILINHLIFPPYLKGLDIYIYFLLLPLMFIKLKKSEVKIDIFKGLNFYISAVIMSVFVLLITNIFKGNIEFKTNTFFSKFLDLTHVYYGMFLGVSVVSICILHLSNHKFINDILDGIIVLILLTLLLYIGARVSFVGSSIVLCVFLYQKLKIKNYQKIIISVLFIGLVSFLAFKNSRIKKGIKSIENVYISVKTNNKKDLIHNSWKNMYKRFLITKYTVEELKENYILGIGVENVKDKISTKIINNGYKYFEPINSHNQYLNTFIGMGVFGLFGFSILLIYFIKNTDKKHLIYFIFMLVIMLSESVLERNKGICVFLFFSLLFANQKQLNA